MALTRTKGFSLIEIMIAAALLATLGIMMFVLLTSNVRTRDTVERISGRYHAGRLAIERMTNELSMAYLSAHRNPSTNPIVETQFKGEENSVAFDAFGNIPFLKGAKESDQREISYFIEDDQRTRLPALKRRVHNNLTNDLGKEGRVEILCPNVKSLSFKYWDDDKKFWQSGWSTEGAESRQMLPSRVLIELVIPGEEDKEEKFISEVEIWLKKPINISK